MAESRLIQKQLAGKEDLLLGIGTVKQGRASGIKDITRLNATHFGGILVVDTINDLNSLDRNQLDEQVVFVKETDTTYSYNGTSWVNKATKTVENIGDLATYTGSGSVIVKDINRGGTFVSKTEVDIDPNTGSVYTVNGSTVFVKLGGGFWVRQYSGAINVKWFGTEGGDITEALKDAVDYLGVRGGGVVTIPAGEYTISNTIRVNHDNIHIAGQGKVVLNANGIPECAIVYGTQQSSRDIRPDNLPMYPASDVFDPAHFSPATENYPRYKNVGLHNINIVRHIDGLAIGFYRVDGFVCKDVSVSFVNNTIAGANTIRTFYCVGGEFDNVKIGASECTYGFFTYWSYGIHFNRVETQANRMHAFEFKGVKQCSLRNSRIHNDNPALALTVGYGSKGVTIENCEIVCQTGNGVVLTSAEEFDYAHRIHLLNCSIMAGQEGLRISRLYKSTIQGCSISGTRAISFYCEAFVTGTSGLEGFSPSQNTLPFTYDGNYDVSRQEGAYLRYLENRPYPAFLDSAVIDCSLNGSQTITGKRSFYEGGTYLTGVLDGNRLKRFSSVRELSGSREAGRVTVPYSQYMKGTAPFSIQDSRFEGLTLSGEAGLAELDFSTTLKRNVFRDVTTLGVKGVLMVAQYVEDCVFENVKMNAPAGSTVQPLIQMDRADNIVFTGCIFSGGNTLLELGNSVNTLDAVRRIMFDGCEFRYATIMPSNRVLTLRFGSNVDSVYVGTPVEFRNCNLRSLSGANIDAWVQSHQGVAPSWDSPGARLYGMVVRECKSNGADHVFSFTNAGGPLPANRPNFLGQLAINSAEGTYKGRVSIAVSGFRSPSEPIKWVEIG